MRDASKATYRTNNPLSYEDIKLGTMQRIVELLEQLVRGGRLVDMETGLARRELFAAMAMQGLLTSDVDLAPELLVHSAVTHADALIYELDERAEGGRSPDDEGGA